MPIENVNYSCCICNAKFNKYEDAEKCEKSHKSPVSVDKAEYKDIDRKSAYPLSVLIHFSDNTSARYYRKEKG